MKIEYYKTNDGLYLKLKPKSGLLVNGEEPKPTHSQNWTTVNGDSITKVEQVVGRSIVNRRFELTKNEVKGIPEVIPYEELEFDSDGDWAGKYSGLENLYTQRYEMQDNPPEPVDFEDVELGEFNITSLGDPTKFKFTVTNDGGGFFGSKPEESIIDYKSIFDYEFTKFNISVDDIVKATVPDFAWHLYPCSISSQLTYRIIRSHVKRNIDLSVATISSDYDFCFTVKKLIKCKPWTSRREVLTSAGKSYRTPKYVTNTYDHKTAEIFEMTHAGSKYDRYTVIGGFRGENLQDLADRIDFYLYELMRTINEPTKECEHCNGTGVEVIEKCKKP